jgi:hypothetical protein
MYTGSTTRHVASTQQQNNLLHQAFSNLNISTKRQKNVVGVCQRKCKAGYKHIF